MTLELIYILAGTLVTLGVIYLLRKYIVTHSDNDEEEVADPQEIARQELESMLVHEDIVLEEKDIEKEVDRENYLDADEESENQDKL